MTFKRALGDLLVVLGILIMVLSGGCTLYFVAIAIAPDGGFGTVGELLGLVAVFGLPPLLLGLFLYWIGKRMKRDRGG